MQLVGEELVVGENNFLPGCLFYGVFRLSVILKFTTTSNTSLFPGLRGFMHEQRLDGRSPHFSFYLGSHVVVWSLECSL